MADLVSIEGHRWHDHCRDDAVRVLEEWLERAKKGELAGVALVATRPDGGTDAEVSKFDHGPALLGSITVLQAKMLKALGG